MAITFEGYERRIDKITKVLAENGISSLEEALQICEDKGIDPRKIVVFNKNHQGGGYI